MSLNLSPRFMSRREFTGLDEDEINRLTAGEQEKLEESPYAMATMDEVESEVGSGGTWEQHWITIDDDRVYASIYYHGDIGVAVTADGHIVRRFRTDS
jgi:hypothetical protein